MWKSLRTYPRTTTTALRGRRIQQRQTVVGSALRTYPRTAAGTLCGWEITAPPKVLGSALKHLILAAVLLAIAASHSFAQEAELIAVLRSEATPQEKSAACRKLARIATKEAVPALAALLGDEKLSHMARYALETIPDPSVDAALRDALGKVQGQARLGVIGSLGVRGDLKAVGALAGLLKGTDADAAQAAARALGNIGASEAAEELEAALPAPKAATNWPSARAFSAAPRH